MHVNVVGSLAVVRRLFEYIDLPPEITDAPSARDLGQARGAIRFEDVTFTYPGGCRPALDNVTIDIAPGQLAALVGPSGAGKTTLTLFHASLADNLRCARPDAAEADLIEAAKSAYLHDFAVSLPDGYDTVVGERGHRLSGGEKQRVAIARAILKDPRILILDEATSHLDTVSEQLIQAALQPLLRGRTSLVIAHRLSTVLSADVILVLDHGRLAEHGTRTELVERSGLYATLYQRQFLAQDRGAVRTRAG